MAPIRRPAAALILALFVALGLSAIQWLPTAAILGSGSRLQMPQEEKLYWSVHPALLTNLFVDLEAPRVVNASTAKVLFEGRDPFLYSLLLGIGTLLAAGAGLCSGPSSVVRMLGWLALFCLCCALGRYFVVYPFLAHIPPFSILRYPVKYTALLALAVALLAGFGVEAWAGELPAASAPSPSHPCALACSSRPHVCSFGSTRAP